MVNWQEPKKFKSRFMIRKPISILQSLMVLYLAVWSISPPLSIDNIYRIIALACAATWFFFELLTGKPLRKMHILALLFLLLVVLVGVIQNNGEWSKLIKLINYYMAVMAFIMAYSYSYRMHELKWLAPICLLLFIYFNFITYGQLLLKPGLARMLSRTTEELFVYQRKGVGGYDFVYSQVIIFPVVLAWAINGFKKKKWLFFAIGVVWLISYYLMMMSSGYSIASFATLASIIILLFYNKRSVVPAFLITLAMIGAVILMIGYVDPVREFLLDLFETTKVGNKIHDIYDSVHGLGTADSISTRMEAYVASFTTIMDYIFIGSLWNPGGGGHSAILDTFSKYGLFGGVVFSYMIFNVPTSLKKTTGDHFLIKMANSLLVSLLLVTVLNTVSYNMIFPMMIMTPLLINDIQKWRKTDEHTLDRKSHPKRSVPQAEHSLGESRGLDRVDGRDLVEISADQAGDRL